MAVYDIKDSVSTCKHWKARVGTCEQEKCRWLHPKFGIIVSYFWSLLNPCLGKQLELHRQEAAEFLDF